MKRTAFVLMLAAFVAICAFTLLPPGSPEYIGTKSCKGCHKGAKGGKVFSKWEKSPHSKAFKTLQTADADKIAKDAGYEGKAAETEFCLSCHVTGMLKKGAKFGKKFDNSEGVGCEACHGPGKGYKTKHSKPENLDKAVKAGFLTPKVADGSAEKQCKECHNKKSPTYKPFDMKKKWAKVAHPKDK